MLDLARQPFHEDPVITKGPDRPDISAHAAAGHHVELDPIFLQHLNDANMSQAASAAGGKSQPEPAAPNLAGQPANVRMKMVTWPALLRAHGARRGTAMNETVY